MNDPGITLRYDSSGAAQTDAEMRDLDATMRQLKASMGMLVGEAAETSGELDHAARTAKRLKAEIESLKDSARLDIARSESKAYADALRDADMASQHLAASQGRLNANVEMATASNANATRVAKGLAVAGFAVAASAAIDLAQQAVAAARGVADFAKAGADAKRVAAQFSGDIEALRKSSVGLMDDTTLQRWHNVGTEIGFSSEQVENLTTASAKLFSEGFGESAAKNMEALINGEAEALRKLGISIDSSAEEFKGLSDSQKKYAIGAKVAADAAKIQIDSIDQSNLGIEQAGVEWDNFVSELQVAAAEFLQTSGMLDVLSDALAGAQEWFQENRDVVEKLGKFGFKILTTSLERLEPAFSLIVDVVSVVVDVFGEAEGAIDAVAAASGALLSPLGWVADAGEALGRWAAGYQSAGSGLVSTLDDVAAAHARAAVAAQKQLAAEKALLNVDSGVDVDKAIADATALAQRFAELRGEGLDVDNAYSLLAEDLISSEKNIDGARTKLLDLGADVELALSHTRGEVQRLEREMATAQWGEDGFVEAASSLAGLREQVRQLEFAQIGVTSTTDELIGVEKEMADETDKSSTKVKHHIDTLGYLRDGYVELYRVMGGGREDAGGGQWWADMTRAALAHQAAVDMVRDAYAAVARTTGGVADMFGADVLGGWDKRPDEIAGPSSGTAGDLDIIQQGSVEDTLALEIAARTEIMDQWNESLSVSQSTFESFAGSLGEYTDSAAGDMLRLADSVLAASGAIAESGDEVASALATIGSGMGDSKQAWTSLAGAGLSAVGAFTTGFVKDQKTQAGILAAIETGWAIKEAASLNFIGAAGHAAAAVQFGLVASGALGSSSGASSGGRSGGGASGGQQSSLADRYAPTLPDSRRDRDTIRETTIVQLQVDGRTMGEVAIGGANRLHSTYRDQQTLDATVTGRGARRLPA